MLNICRLLFVLWNHIVSLDCEFGLDYNLTFHAKLQRRNECRKVAFNAYFRWTSYFKSFNNQTKHSGCRGKQRRHKKWQNMKNEKFTQTFIRIEYECHQFFFCIHPHLLRTIRLVWENSSSGVNHVHDNIPYSIYEVNDLITRTSFDSHFFFVVILWFES